MNNKFIKSTLILSIATVVSKIIGSIFRIPLQNIAGDEVFGIFNLVYPVYMVALIMSVAGIPVAISKLISAANVNKDYEQVEKVHKTASILALLFGLTSFIFIVTFSTQIADLLGGQNTRPALIIVATTLLIAPYMAVYRGYFQGFENMVPTAISQVIEQFTRVSLILVIAFLLVKNNYANEFIAGGIMVGSSVGAFASLIYLRILYKKFNRTQYPKQRRKQSLSKQQFKQMSKTILSLSIPISVGAITMALVNFIDSLTIPISLVKANIASDMIHYLYGIYGRGLSLIQITTIFSSSLVLPLIPLITKMFVEKDWQEARNITEKTFFLAHLISWPAAFGLFALTLPLNIALFTNTEGSNVLAVIGLSSLFASLSILGTGILQGMDLAKQAAYIIVGSVLVKVITNLFLIKSFGLIGAAYSTLIIYILICTLNLYVIFKNVPFSIWTKGQTLIVTSTLIMAVVIGLPTLYFQVEEWSRRTALVYCSLAIIIGATLYFLLLFTTKVLRKEDMKGLIKNAIILKGVRK